ncbi:diguanylate cyclase [Rhodanobacter glycinis]|uniref:histidine kinase n=1 Tax=Rhodanobacter glycinis TaxID=582702 RepID=A0A502F6Y2_9GAMM|nr:diguanylate cyclase [Rhodanobacter glycinis]TPG08512.1 diguanylate cyclase [Rhodanobacter glycinis]TPG44851.1 diguanylate cyclase [Rhodanobacter glycinis]
MSSGPIDDAEAVALAARELAQLQLQAEQVRTVLDGLQQNLIEVESSLDSSQAAQLLEANEHLMQAALLAHSHADTVKQALEQVSRAAELDALTKLPNRPVLFDRLAQAIAMAKRTERRVAILFIDLDKFKQINDTLGHTIGDEVLQLAAHCLCSSVRDADTVSRHGGDEFLILLPELSEASDAALIADKVITALAMPSRLGDHVLRLAASIGISIYPDDGADADTLIHHADIAMYRAKMRSAGSVEFYGSQAADEPLSRPKALASLKRPLVRYEDALLEHERRHAHLCEANEQLLMAVLNAQDLQAAAEQAQRKQIEFLALVAHELRTPLTPIRIATSLMVEVGPEELPRMQAIIERQVTHITRLVTDLLDISRINTGKLRIECRRIDIVTILDAAIEGCRPAMDLRLQNFRLQLPAVVVEVQGDPVRLTQVMSNLITNASKCTQEGGQIRLRLVTTDTTAVITLTDNGIGISATAMPEIFNPFVQDAHAIGFNGTGLGIGLTVVRELVEAHGGTIEATSNGKGFGSQFVVTLPLASASLPS